jgi:hypothetical protein
MKGPIESEYGYHLVLVMESTDCPKLDEWKAVRIPTSSNDVFDSLVPSG